MTIVSDALSILDDARGLLDDVGLRPYQVFVRVTAWSGARAGLGTKTVTDTELTVADGKRPKVRQLSAKDVVASGGSLSDQIFEIGPLTPPFTGGGTEASVINPALDADAPTGVLYVLMGPGAPADGWLCKRVGDKLDSPFRYMVTVQRIGVDAAGL